MVSMLASGRSSWNRSSSIPDPKTQDQVPESQADFFTRLKKIVACYLKYHKISDIFKTLQL